jgi:hypothetical protein
MLERAGVRGTDSRYLPGGRGPLSFLAFRPCTSTRLPGARQRRKIEGRSLPQVEWQGSIAGSGARAFEKDLEDARQGLDYAWPCQRATHGRWATGLRSHVGTKDPLRLPLDEVGQRESDPKQAGPSLQQGGQTKQADKAGRLRPPSLICLKQSARLSTGSQSIVGIRRQEPASAGRLQMDRRGWLRNLSRHPAASPDSTLAAKIQNLGKAWIDPSQAGRASSAHVPRRRRGELSSEGRIADERRCSRSDNECRGEKHGGFREQHANIPRPGGAAGEFCLFGFNCRPSCPC